MDLTLGRRNQETSVINSAFVNANLQAVLNYAQKVAMRSFFQATLNACHGQNNLVNTFISGLLGNRPHLVARKLLQKQYLFARVTLSAIEIYPCAPVNDYTIKPMSECSARIPIIYHIHGHKFNGHLDPVDIVIYQKPDLQPCHLVHEFPITLENKTYIYIRNGSLIPVKNVENLTITNFYNARPLTLDTMPIFKHLVIYEQGDLSAGVTSNDIFNSIEFQNQLKFHDEEHGYAIPRAAKPFNKFSWISIFLFSTFHGIWAFLCHIYVTVMIVGAIVKGCYRYQKSRSTDQTPQIMSIVATADQPNSLLQRVQTSWRRIRQQAGTRLNAEQIPIHLGHTTATETQCSDPQPTSTRRRQRNRFTLSHAKTGRHLGK